MFPQLFMTKNEHAISIMFFTGQGGAIEEYFAWCHVCSPDGSAFVWRLDFEDWPFSTDDAVEFLVRRALDHASEDGPDML